MPEKRSMEQFLADAEEYRQERLCEARADLYGMPYNAVEIPAEMCERLDVDRCRTSDGYRGFRWNLQRDIIQLLDRLFRVQKRLPELVRWARYPGRRNDVGQAELIREAIRNPQNWLEWITTGQCAAFRVLPPGLVPVASTDLDDEALEIYGGRGYDLSQKAEKLWEEANAMMLYGPGHSCQCKGFEVTESLSKEQD